MVAEKYLISNCLFNLQVLIREKASILEISENCGFNSAAYFSKLFSEAMGCTPHQYRTGAGQPGE